MPYNPRGVMVKARDCGIVDIYYTLCLFAVFTYNGINGFVFIITWPTRAIVLLHLYFRFNIVGPYSVFFFFCAATRIDSIIIIYSDGFLLEFEWQQVSLRLQDSSQYFGRS